MHWFTKTNSARDWGFTLSLVPKTESFNHWEFSNLMVLKNKNKAKAGVHTNYSSKTSEKWGFIEIMVINKFNSRLGIHTFEVYKNKYNRAKGFHSAVGSKTKSRQHWNFIIAEDQNFI